MIVVDTNVVSELMRLSPDPRVRKWIDQLPARELFTTVITVGEVYFGIELLPRSKRRDTLLNAAEIIFSRDFADRVLPLTTEAARIFSRISARRRIQGRPISQSDAQIAAIVQHEKGTLATRNTADFEDCGIRVVDPWRAS